MYKFIAFALVVSVSCNDLAQGPAGGRKIYDENKEASPAIWKQKDEVTIKANDTDVIKRIVITDLRPDKDGEAKIIEGGEGQKNVTVELKSPTILRGYYFHIEVYVDDEQHIAYPEESITTESYPEEVPLFTKPIAVMKNDTKVNVGEIVTESDKSVSQVLDHDKGQKAPSDMKRKTDSKSRQVDPIV